MLQNNTMNRFQSELSIHERWSEDSTFIKIKSIIEKGEPFDESWPKDDDDNYDFEGIHIKDSDSLIGYKFPKKCNLKNSVFENSYLANCEFEECILSNTQFENCSLRSTKFLECCLDGALFFKCNLSNCYCKKSNYNDVVFEDTDLHNIKFLDCDLPNLENFLNRHVDNGMKLKNFMSSGLEKWSVTIILILCIISLWTNHATNDFFYLTLVMLTCIISHIGVRAWKVFRSEKRSHTGWLKEEIRQNFLGASNLYLTLKLYYKSVGKFDMAGKAHYRYSVNLRKTKNLRRRIIEYFFQECLIGYGEKKSRVIRSSLVIILLFACVYYDNDSYTFVRFNNSGCIESEFKLNEFEAIYFSTVTFATLGYGDISPALRSNRLYATNTKIKRIRYGFSILVPALESVLGCITIATFVVVFARMFIRD